MPFAAVLTVIFACFMSLGTTFVIKENGVEVGRWTENDGSDRVEEVENRVAKTPAADPAVQSPAPGQKNQRYDWTRDSRGYETAVGHLQKTGEPVFLYFWANWCPVCKKFDKEIFDRNVVREFLAPYMKVRIDEKEKALMQKFGVRGYPTFIVLTQKGGKEVPRYSDPAEFMQACRKAGLVAK